MTTMRLFVLVVALLTKATALIVSGAGAVNNHAINVLTSVSLPLDVDGRRVMLHLAAGDDPSEAAAAFLAEHGYEDNQELLTALERSIALRVARAAQRDFAR